MWPQVQASSEDLPTKEAKDHHAGRFWDTKHFGMQWFSIVHSVWFSMVQWLIFPLDERCCLLQELLHEAREPREQAGSLGRDELTNSYSSLRDETEGRGLAAC